MISTFEKASRSNEHSKLVTNRSPKPLSKRGAKGDLIDNVLLEAKQNYSKVI